jgi:hypothetical protein
MAKAKKGGKKPTKKKAAPENMLVGLNETDNTALTTDNTTLNTLYITDGSDNDITLEVNAGAQGQTSDMTIKLNSTIVTENLSGDFAETILGTNNSLNGKKLNIVATIADTSRETNFTSLTIHLRGGAGPADFPLSKAVDEEGGSVDYLCIIEFFEP